MAPSATARPRVGDRVRAWVKLRSWVRNSGACAARPSGMPSFLTLLFALLAASSCDARSDGLVVEGNPHADATSTVCCPAQRLPAETLLPEPTKLTT